MLSIINESCRLSNTLCNMPPGVLHKLNKMETSFDRLLRGAKELGKADTQAALARRLDESEQTIQNWKSRGVPKSKLIKIEDKIGLLPKWVVTGQGEMTKTLRFHESTLTEEQIQVLAIISGIRSEARETWIKLGGYLAEQMPERRMEDKGNEMERRQHFGVQNAKRLPRSKDFLTKKKGE